MTDDPKKRGYVAQLAYSLIPEEAAKVCAHCGVRKAGAIEPHLDGCPALAGDSFGEIGEA